MTRAGETAGGARPARPSARTLDPVHHGTGLESLLRLLVRRAGLGRALEERGLDRTLDLLAKGDTTEQRRLSEELEKEIARLIERECGTAWVTSIRGAWDGFKAFTLAGMTRVDRTRGPALPYELNWLGLSLRGAWRRQPCLDIEVWLEAPFAAWVDCLCAAFGTTRVAIRRRICTPIAGERRVSGRTFDRWLAGGNIRALPAGHRALVEAAVGPVDSWVIDCLTGWLLITIALQHMDVTDRRQLLDASPFLGLARPASTTLSREAIDEACRFVGEVTRPYQEGELDGPELEDRLDGWHDIASGHPMTRVQYGRLRARIAAGRGEDATKRYEAVADVSACIGWLDREHQACLLEALAYSRSIGSGRAFRHFWDRTRKSMVFGKDTAGAPSERQSAYIDRIVELGPRCLRLVVIHGTD